MLKHVKHEREKHRQRKRLNEYQRIVKRQRRRETMDTENYKRKKERKLCTPEENLVDTHNMNYEIVLYRTYVSL